MSNNFTLNDSGLLIDAVKGSRVSGLFVEFLQQGGIKPHVVFRLVLRSEAVVDGRKWLSCRLAMDLIGDIEGAFYITPLRYANTSNAAHAAFEFGLKTDTWTVDNYISAITQPDLTNFNFVGGFFQSPSKTEYLDGCRDFMYVLPESFSSGNPQDLTSYLKFSSLCYISPLGSSQLECSSHRSGHFQ